jgi:hypothetical protein
MITSNVFDDDDDVDDDDFEVPFWFVDADIIVVDKVVFEISKQENNDYMDLRSL